MWLLGLILPVCYIAPYTGWTIPSQWVVLSAVLPLASWRKGEINFLHGLWAAFVGYAFLTFWWTPSVNDSIYAVWTISIWALSFWLGSTLTSLLPLWKGLAIGISVSSLVAIIQWAGYHPVEISGGFPGLFYNVGVSGAAAALILIALLIHRLWFYVPCVLPSLVLAQSRGAWLVLILALICKYLHWRIALLALAGAGLVLYLQQGPSDIDRLHIWQVAWLDFSWFGKGAGMFSDLWFRFDGHFERPGYAHNDYIQLWFEFGFASLAIFAIGLAALSRTTHAEWPVLVAFAVLGLFYFPLYCPVPAFIGMVVAGYITRDWSLVRACHSLRGFDAAPRLREFRPAYDDYRVPDVSLEQAS